MQHIPNKTSPVSTIIRLFFLFTLLITVCTPLRAQGVLRGAEYFWNDDPGEGNAQSMPAADGQFDDALETAINQALTPPPGAGINLFSVRFQDSTGYWGPVFKRTIAVEDDVRDIQITLAEYFWDADPGEGAGTTMVAFDGDFDNAIETALSSTVAAPTQGGLHLFNVRVRDENDSWGPVFKRTIAVEDSPRDIKITLAEYFWDNDPGEGTGTAMIAFDGDFNDAIETAISSSITAPSQGGLHLFNVRVRDENDSWGPVFKRTIAVEDSPRDIKITLAEYFWDNDPGEGSGTALIAFDGDFNDAIETAISDNITTSLQGGLHLFNVRVKDENDSWGPVFKRTLVVEDTPRDIKISLAEYFWDTDPGEGAGTAMIAFDGDFNDAIETALSSAITTPTQGGLHLFNVRIQDENETWGPVFMRTISTQESPRNIQLTAAEYFWGFADPGEGSGIAMAVFDGAFDEAIESALSNGLNSPGVGLALYNIRVQDENGDWGPLFKRTVYVDVEMITGCQDPMACNYNASANDEGECIFSDGICETCSGQQDGTGTIVDNDADNDGICDNDEILGCQDATACNYNAAATDSGECIFPPTIDLGEDIETCEEAITLDAGPGYDSYLWSTGETTQTIEVIESGDYSVEVFNDVPNSGNSMSFDGDYIDINSLNTHFSAYDDFSFHGFFKTNNSYSTGQGLIFSTSDSNYDNATLWMGVKNDQILVQYFDGVSPSEYLYFGDNCSDNQWHSLGLTVNNQGDMFVYLDGVEVGQEDDVQLDFNFAEYYSLAHEWDPVAIPSDFFIGNLDDISIWNTTLSSEDIQQYMQCTPVGDEAGLVGYWNFNEGSGSVVTDLSGNGNDGVINGATFSEDVPETNCPSCTSSDTISVSLLTKGCKDPAACNYSEEVLCDDGSCILPDGICETCSGQQDGTGIVVDNDADNDGICNNDEIVGCQDQSACNYNIIATDEGACIFPDGICETCSGQQDGTGTVVNNDVDNDSVCDNDEIVGCQDQSACNYNIIATDEGACIFPDGICETCSGQQDGTGTIVDNDEDNDGICNNDEILGCQDQSACNYNNIATDEGACIFPDGICETCSGQQDGTGTVVDNDADNDGICNNDEIVGCQDQSACNYNIIATDEGACIFPDGICETCSGQQDGTGTVVNNDVDNDSVCDNDEIVGCQDQSACNYNIIATDEGACIFPDGICETCSGQQDGTGTIVDNDEDNDGICNNDEILGCQDQSACNYNNIATDEGACIFPDGICETCSGQQDGTGTVVDNDADNDGICNNDEIVGCQNPMACNYNDASTEQEVCIFPFGTCETCSGEQDGTGVIIINDADNDGVCDNDEIVGCQDQSACNYNIIATDEGACIFPDGICETCSGQQDGTGTIVDNDEDNDGICNNDEILGCQDQSACNYNNIATDEGACIFPDGICETCSGQQDGTGTVVDNDADNDGICNNDEIVGCQNPMACNYNDASTEQEVCIFPFGTCETCSGEQDGTGVIIINDADNDGVCDNDEIVGCQDQSACNYNIIATDEGACIFPDGICETCSGQQDGTGTIVDNDADNDGICNNDEILGCQDQSACNYNTAATDEGACIFPDGICETCSGQQDGTGTVADNDADNDGICNNDEIVGCQDQSACNYNTAATDAGACIFPDGICETCSGQQDGTGTVVDNDEDNDGICNNDEIVGCQDQSACNYNTAATDAGACIFPDGICETCSGQQDGTGTVVDNDADNDGVCDNDEIIGCQDQSACNYNAAATDAGACIFPDGICETCSGQQDGTGTIVDNDADNDGICDNDEGVGCQDQSACNYNIFATDEGACIFPDGICDTCSGQQDGTGNIVDNDTDGDGVCDNDEIVGCQNQSACNYNIIATDEGACIFPDGICETCSGQQDGTGTIVDNDADNDGVCDNDEIVGCQDQSACNYNITATDEGACIFPDGICDTCSGQQDGTGTIVDNDADNDGICNNDEIEGCQNPMACNYNVASTEPEVCIFPFGSCETCSGQQDGTGVIIINDADNDGVCDNDEIVGCQDQSACNYNIFATDEGACIFPDGICETCAGLPNGTGTIVDNDADNDGVCDNDEIVGCQDQSACNYNTAATDAGACIFPDGICETCSGQQDGTGIIVDNDADNDGVCDNDEITGCQDEDACNYNMLATDSDNCTFPEGVCDTCSGEQDGTGTIVDNDADNDGVCDNDEIVGCQDQSACNYNTAATDAGACIFPDGICETCSGQQDGTGIIVDNDADNDGVCDNDEITGCQDEDACNYNMLATDSDNCTFPEGVCDTCSGEQDGTGTIVDNDADNDGVCDNDEIVGCQDQSACNYNTAATDAGACIFPDGICETCSGQQDGTGTVVDNDVDNDGVCDNDEIIGCQNPMACNYNDASTEQEVCIFPEGVCDTCSGEQDGTGVVIDNDTDNDGVCDNDEIVGCQDATACNYNITATDAGTCIFPDGICETCSGQQDGTGNILDNDADNDGICDNDEIIGCQNDQACNFNISATDEGACTFPDGICETCSGQQDGTGTIVDNDADNDGICDNDEIVGCQETTACNYNIFATDLGNCIFPEGICETCSGQQDGTGTIVDNDADNDGICDNDEGAGCQDETACNYNAAATDEGACIFPFSACETCSGQQDGTGVIIVNDADNDGVCDNDEIIGCQNDQACNFNISATDEGACIFPEDICDTCSGQQDGTGTIVDNDLDNDGVCDNDEIEGCQDTTACNYNIAATDAGNCIFPEGFCDTCSGQQDGTGTIVYNDLDNDGVCDNDEIVGCQDTTACNYNIAATDAGNCIFLEGICDTCSGQLDGTGIIVDNDLDNDGVCDNDEIVGCQDTTACNYNIAATDAGNCIFPEDICDTCSGQQDGTGTIVDNDLDNDGVCDNDEIEGCQDTTACNYNIAATDAGNCIFPEDICDTCSGQQDGTGTIVDNDADNDGVCDNDEIEGCQDTTACNYNIAATDSDNCIFLEGICDTCSGQQDGTGIIVENDLDNDGVCDNDEIVGCQDTTACNYDSLATDEGDCEYVDAFSIIGNLTPVVLNIETYTYTMTMGSTYAWTCTGGTIQSGNGTNEIEIVWSATGTGEVCVTETTADECSGEQVCSAIAILSTNIEEQMMQSINIFPNPASTSVIISIDESLINENYQLFDTQGRMVSAGLLKATTTTLNTISLASGNYLISIDTKKGLIREQIIIQK